ncbi:MAG: hypothetical protein RR293_07575 [Bacteroidales bacterium]
MNKRLKYILLILTLIACNVIAQTSWEASPLLQTYKKGEGMFRDGNYRGSRDITTEFTEKGEDFKVLYERAKFMCAKASYLSEDKDAETLLKDFIQDSYDASNL